MKRAASPFMNAHRSSARARWAAGVMRPTQGALHLSMYPSRHGLPELRALRNTPMEQERTGKTRRRRSMVSRIAHAWV